MGLPVMLELTPKELDIYNTDTAWETSPEPVEVPADAARAEAAQPEPLPMRKQEWL